VSNTLQSWLHVPLNSPSKSLHFLMLLAAMSSIATIGPLLMKLHSVLKKGRLACTA
jgi:hypothetical protein